MAAKRLRHKKCAPGQLRAYWGREGRGNYPDVILAHGGGTASKRDTTLLFIHLCTKRPTGYNSEYIPSLMDDLRERGYDISTLEFSIKKLPVKP
jgi:hypothetical protein